MIPFKSNFGFADKWYIGPNGIYRKLTNNDISNLSKGDWVVWQGSDAFRKTPISGQPSQACWCGVLIEDINASAAGWVQVYGLNDYAAIGGSPTAPLALMMQYNSTSAITFGGAAGDVRCGMLLTTPALGYSTAVWIGG